MHIRRSSGSLDGQGVTGRKPTGANRVLRRPRSALLGSLPFEPGQEFGRRLDAHAVAEGREKVPPIIGDHDVRAGGTGDFSDVGIVDAAPGNRIVACPVFYTSGNESLHHG